MVVEAADPLPAREEEGRKEQPALVPDSEEEEDPSDYFFEFSRPELRRIKKFRLTGESFDVIFKHLEELADIEAVLLRLVGRILERAFAEGGADALIGIEIAHPALVEGSFLIPFTPRNELTAEKILAAMEKLAQSRKELALDADLRITINRVELPRGMLLLLLLHHSYITSFFCRWNTHS